MLLRHRLALIGLLAAGSAAAQGSAERAANYQAALWAASCNACHGTDGRAEGVGLPLAGRNADELYTILLAFKNGQRPGTIMHQHAKGYTDEELQRIARQFAAVRR